MLEFVVWVVNERCSHVEDNAWLRRQRVVWLARDGIDSGKEYIFVYIMIYINGICRRQEEGKKENEQKGKPSEVRRGKRREANCKEARGL